MTRSNKSDTVLTDRDLAILYFDMVYYYHQMKSSEQYNVVYLTLLNNLYYSLMDPHFPWVKLEYAEKNKAYKVLYTLLSRFHHDIFTKDFFEQSSKTNHIDSDARIKNPEKWPYFGCHDRRPWHHYDVHNRHRFCSVGSYRTFQKPKPSFNLTPELNSDSESTTDSHPAIEQEIKLTYGLPPNFKASFWEVLGISLGIIFTLGTWYLFPEIKYNLQRIEGDEATRAFVSFLGMFAGASVTGALVASLGLLLPLNPWFIFVTCVSIAAIFGAVFGCMLANALQNYRIAKENPDVINSKEPKQLAPLTGDELAILEGKGIDPVRVMVFIIALSAGDGPSWRDPVSNRCQAQSNLKTIQHLRKGLVPQSNILIENMVFNYLQWTYPDRLAPNVSNPTAISRSAASNGSYPYRSPRSTTQAGNSPRLWGSPPNSRGSNSHVRSSRNARWSIVSMTADGSHECRA